MKRMIGVNMPEGENLDKKFEIEEGGILLVLSDFDEYFFHSLICVPYGAKQPLEYEAYPHIGTFRDSFLISAEDEIGEVIDISYFPQKESIEIYSLHTSGLPLFIKNIGDDTLYVKYDDITLEIEPGKRKEFCVESSDYDEFDLASLIL